jgi:hypothetical protein
MAPLWAVRFFRAAACAARLAGFVPLALSFGHPRRLRRFWMLETPPPMCPPRVRIANLFRQWRSRCPGGLFPLGLFQQGPAVVSVRMVPAVRVEITVLTNTLCCLCRTADTARCSRPRASELCLRSRPALIATARLMKICLGSASVSRSGFIPHGRRLARSFSKRVHMMRRDSCSEVTESNVNSMSPVRR